MITLTEKAATELKKVMDEDGVSDAGFVRVGVSGGGCSGFEYKLTFDKYSDDSKDITSVQHGITIVVDKKSDLYLDGTELDFHSSIEKRGFVFNNPNAVKSCGCGSSFQA